MAALFPRRCFGTLGLQQGSSFMLAGPSRRAIRGYAAAATATKQKPKVVARAAKAAPTPKKPALVTIASKAASQKPEVPAKKPAVKSVTTEKTATKPGRPIVLRSSGRLKTKVPEKRDIKKMDEEEQLLEIERVMAMSHSNPTRDVWGHSMETLDVILPHSISLSQRSNYSSWREMYEQFKENCRNAMKNYTSMLTLAQDNSLPGIDLSGERWWHKLIFRWPWRLATTTSVADSSWLTPLRKSALSTYCQLNTALARGDDQTIRELTTYTYKDQALRLKKKQRRDCKYFWHFHKEVTPARVLSIRAAPGYLAIDPPKFGNRNTVQALIRIDTEQSLEIYTELGVPLHTPAAKCVKGGSAAEPVRVTEYFVFEKRMWYDGPWVVREQLWEAPGKKAAI